MISEDYKWEFGGSVSYGLIREDGFAAAAGEQVALRAAQFGWVLVVRPKEHSLRPRPQRIERRLRLPYFRSVWKLRTVPQNRLRLVQHEQVDICIKVQAGSGCVVQIGRAHV